ncbi:WhiB family transcriptional regulator [Rhodococcus sp. D2-41]|uniref:Transcriptional regulator WhiB n=1 Tax=Speluncibacter jeojiensis TaxID=2710754 RepID=A0A9X4M2B9_9ACTN|nr:WhiB family transcriptional regulator [Rhodococcus sp. D2-41]MDG3008932.1 WhiB family transcriptional regulator [Rhodococcus sp. D2-41]MDG3016554.1 WhiB family transcriptional regulator [Corynebacteriales bacterium D3-21]
MSRPHILPGPLSDRWDWQMQGRCRGVDSAVFFHPDGERGRARAARESNAKKLCETCPVLSQCREHALRVAEPYGIWGGMSESEREAAVRSGAGRRVAAQLQRDRVA